jgi:hypothetical protein
MTSNKRLASLSSLVGVALFTGSLALVVAFLATIG